MFKENKDYMTYDYLIIGQGLAGSCMAMRLLKRGKRILVMDKPHENTSSMIAAGIFNPITGRNMVKTWKCNRLFPSLTNFYSELQSELNAKFFNTINIYRPFTDLAQQNEWMGKSALEENLDYIENIYSTTRYPDELNDQYGGLEVKNAGYVDLPIFITAVRDKLKEENAYLETSFDEGQLHLEANGVQYRDIHANRVIFCNGESIANSSLFGWLPYSLVKGEILEVAVDNIPKLIYNRGVFVLPKKDNKCRVGATYDIHDRTYIATKKAKETLVERLNTLYRPSYNVTGQVAGIRPATRDRRPFIGVHPRYANCGIFNGLGAKGVSLAPYFSDQFVHVLENGAALDEEVNINRYKSLYCDNLGR